MEKETEDTENTKELEEDIERLIAKFKSDFGKDEVIAVIYNPKNEEGIQEQDVQFLMHLLKNTTFCYPLILLYGRGGDVNPAFVMPSLLLDNVKSKKYKVYVPLSCCSALCYPVFKADELIITPKTKLTQIDPTFEYNGKIERAIKHLHSTDITLRDKAREIFDDTQNKIISLIKPPSVFKFQLNAYKEFGHVELIVSYFMNKEEHEKEVTPKELRELELNLTEDNDPTRLKLAEDLIYTCLQFMEIKNVRVIFVSSIPFDVEGSGKGTYICPLI